MSEKPLVSICMMCRDLEPFIEEALRSALAQTYSPLEIVVSDDASTDRTWEIVTQVAADYKGPHKLILNRNEDRLGVCGNLQKALSLASGELIVDADGDDVSYPNRVEALVRDWLSTDKKALLMCSSYACIDKTGRKVGEKIYTGGWNDRGIKDNIVHVYIGATIAFSRALYEDFPPISYPQAALDSLLQVRALLARNPEEVTGGGKFRIIPEKLLDYRVNVGVSAKGSYYPARIRAAKRMIAAHRQNLLDIAALHDEKYGEVRVQLEDYIGKLEKTLVLYGSGPFRERCRALRESHLWDNRGFSYKLIALFSLLPARLRDPIINGAYRLFQRFFYHRPETLQG